MKIRQSYNFLVIAMWKIKFLVVFISYLAFAQAQCSTPKVDIKVPLTDDKGTKLKNTCFVAKGMNYTQANAYCKSQKMRLLNVDSEPVRTALINLILDNFEGEQLAFRIDGSRALGSKAFKVADGTKDIYSKLNWVATNDPPKGDDSVVVTSLSYPFMKIMPVNIYFDGVPPSFTAATFCEY